jgi:hypothetical protein
MTYFMDHALSAPQGRIAGTTGRTFACTLIMLARHNNKNRNRLVIDVLNFGVIQFFLGSYRCKSTTISENGKRKGKIFGLARHHGDSKEGDNNFFY